MSWHIREDEQADRQDTCHSQSGSEQGSAISISFIEFTNLSSADTISEFLAYLHTSFEMHSECHPCVCACVRAGMHTCISTRALHVCSMFAVERGVRCG